MLETIEINWELLGAKLAALSDAEQGAFFNGFAAELSHYESKHAAEMQMAYVADKLTDKNKKILEDNFSMLWYKENE